jgi:hypothetical protein
MILLPMHHKKCKTQGVKFFNNTIFYGAYKLTTFH